MKKHIFTLASFIIICSLRYILYLKSKKKQKKNKGIATEMMYLASRFKLDIKKLDTTKIAIIISLLDALIIVTSLEVALRASKSIMLELIIGLILVIALIIGSNEILGRILIKKGYKK